MPVSSFVGKCVATCMLLLVASFWSTFISLSLLYRCIRKGFRTVFYYEDRRNSAPPFHYHAWDEETRDSPSEATKKWNHGYITVPNSGIRFHYVYSGKIPKDLTISDIDGETVVVPDTSTTAESRPKLLLCVHGYPENWFSWRHILRYFDDPPAKLQDYFVVAIDTRGYGGTDKPANYKAYHIYTLADDIRGISEALGYKKCVLAGHDWGGGISWNVAKLYPEIIEKLIILNCPEEKAMEKTFRQQPSQFLKSWYMFFFQMPYLPEIVARLSDFKMIESAFNGRHGGMCDKEKRLTKGEVEVFKYSLRDGFSGPINYYRAAIWPFAWPGPKLKYDRKRIKKPLHTIPVMLIWGTGDKFLSIKGAQNTKDVLNEENGSKVIYVDGASHWVQQDAPVETIKHITDFLTTK